MAPTPVMALAPGARLGRYEIANLLGAGGVGEVYRARDPGVPPQSTVSVTTVSAGKG